MMLETFLSRHNSNPTSDNLVLTLFRPSCSPFFFFQAEDGIRDKLVTGVQTCAPSDLRSPAAASTCQRRPSVREVHAIRGISFVINHADAVGIIGRNGSGKSTLLQAIAGLLPPEQGCVYTSGQAALLGVNAALLDDLTGERNVVLGCLAMGMTPQETKDRYQSIVDFSGVGNFIDYPMRTYSSGMAQRLRFSIASAKNHEILMIDEALATGDANFRTKSHERIMQLRAEAGTVFLVAHNLAEIEASCNRVIWLG